VEAREALGVVAAGRTLTRAEAESTMGSVMAGEATPAQLAALLDNDQQRAGVEQRQAAIGHQA